MTMSSQDCGGLAETTVISPFKEISAMQMMSEYRQCLETVFRVRNSQAWVAAVTHKLLQGSLHVLITSGQTTGSPMGPTSLRCRLKWFLWTLL